MAFPLIGFAPAALIALKVGLLAIVSGVVARVLLSIGFAVVTVKGVDVAIDTVINMLKTAESSLPSDVHNLFLMAGGGYCLNMICAAISFRLSYWALTKSVRVLGVKA